MWKQKVKAGIMLYALFMAAVFSLLLQFYLHRQTANHRNFTLNRERTQAYAMAAVANENPKQRNFEQGYVQDQKDEKEFILTVTMKTGRRYQFSFSAKKEKQMDKKLNK